MEGVGDSDSDAAFARIAALLGGTISAPTLSSRARPATSASRHVM